MERILYAIPSFDNLSFHESNKHLSFLYRRKTEVRQLVETGATDCLDTSTETAETANGCNSGTNFIKQTPISFDVSWSFEIRMNPCLNGHLLH